MIDGSTTVLVSCGEPSGDLYAGALVREIKALDGSARILGLGGEGLRKAGGELAADYGGLTVTGLAEALAVLPRSLATYRRLVAGAKRARPDVFVAIDFPEFNLRLARAMRRLGVPVVYYISPQVWAWRPRRLETMKQIAAHVLVIFPFEEEIYRRAGIPVTFVGHPLVDLATPDAPRDAFLSSLRLDPGAPTVALLPGSRPNELGAILPDLSRAAVLIRRDIPSAQFIVARAPNLDDRLFAPVSMMSAGGAPVAVVESRTDTVLASSDVVLTASGTATVQAALHERPMVIVYRLSPLTYRLGRRFVRVDTYGMANLVAGRRVVPELIQDAFTPEAVAREAVRFLADPQYARATREALREVRRRLGSPGASRRAAEEVLRIAESV
ncbi:MAG: lipid-A-disaccharide synthase [Acidobacteria bacterium]|nr:lipid-A-disaccharide synthase [Acidobacteriota bacterium]